jgi:hypothetical protein
MLLVLAILVVLAVLAPLFGADSRDGLDWAPDNFWLRRRSRPDDFKTTDSREPASAGHASADGCRTAPAAG